MGCLSQTELGPDPGSTVIAVRPWASQETSNVWSLKRGAGCLLLSLQWTRHQHPKGKMLESSHGHPCDR